jgi:hypothetical protein
MHEEKKNELMDLSFKCDGFLFNSAGCLNALNTAKLMADLVVEGF